MQYDHQANLKATTPAHEETPEKSQQAWFDLAEHVYAPSFPHAACGDMQHEHQANLKAITPAHEKSQQAWFDLAEHVSAPSFPHSALDKVAQFGNPIDIV